MIRFDLNGRLDQAKIVEYRERAQSELSKARVPLRIIRRILAIAVEFAQNVQRYGPYEGGGVGHGSISIVQNRSGYEVTSRNRVVDPVNEPILVSRLESIDSKSGPEVDQMFHERRRGEGTARGAGLGFIEIARKSDIGLQWSFVEMLGGHELELRAFVRSEALENYSVDRGPDTLGVLCDAIKGEVNLEGSSYPEDAFAFFEPIGEWVESFLRDSGRTISIVCFIDYLNSSSSKSLFDLFDLVEQSLSSDASAGVTWRYARDDPDARMVGEEFAEDVSIPFTFEEIG